MQSNPRKTLFLLFALSFLITTFTGRADANSAPAIIPKPAKMGVKSGAFPLGPSTQILVL